MKRQLPNGYRREFNGSSTALEVLKGKDLSEQVAIVTGANSGIGFETARSLALHGCRVVFACRNLSLAEEAIETIRKERPEVGKNCEVSHLDLSLLRNVTGFCEIIRSKFNAVDILVLNAGVVEHSHRVTEDGYEMTFQVCHLSHFYLTLLLRPVLKKGSRVVVVSSEAHRVANLDAKTLSPTTLSPDAKKYWDFVSYPNAKLCNLLFAQELARRWQQQGISVLSVHPGSFVATNIPKIWLHRLFIQLARPFTKSLQQAASTPVFCATSSDLNDVTGLYFNNCAPSAPKRSALDENFARSLWDISLDMIKTALGDNTPWLTNESD